MKIDSIQNGIVLDHIKAGNAMKIYFDLGLDKLDCSVAIIQRATSGKMGKKDIIKIDSASYDINLDVIGYIDPNVTVSIIKDGVTVEKKKVNLPEKLVNIKHSQSLPSLCKCLVKSCEEVFPRYQPVSVCHEIKAG